MMRLGPYEFDPLDVVLLIDNPDNGQWDMWLRHYPHPVMLNREQVQQVRQARFAVAPVEPMTAAALTEATVAMRKEFGYDREKA